jgi:hypothetical protein
MLDAFIIQRIRKERGDVLGESQGSGLPLRIEVPQVVPDPFPLRESPHPGEGTADGERGVVEVDFDI